MKFHLPLGPLQNDFYGKILLSIQKYYPIGIKSGDPAYHQFPGQVELGKIIVDNIHNNKNFKVGWKDFEKEIKKETRKEIDGQTYATKPSFSSRLIIKRFKHAELIHIKSLHFSVSLVGPFFTIFGMDETAITDDKDGRELFFGAVNIVTVSPYKEFESDFNYLRTKIEGRFTGYKFIPFRLGSMLIDGLYDPFEENKECTIYSALFDDCLDGYNIYKTRGDSSYGFDEWINREGDYKIDVSLGPPPERP